MSNISMPNGITKGRAMSSCSLGVQTPAATGLFNAASDWAACCVITIRRQHKRGRRLSYQADHEILKRLKRKKCEAKRDAYHRARKLLEANKEQAIKVAEYLIEHGKIDGVAVERLFPV